jgi:hypothetical protein
MMPVPDAAVAVGFGDRPAPRQLRLVAFKPLRKNSLRGFASVWVPLWQSMTGLTIRDCPVLVSAGRAWVALPGKPQIDPDGRQKKDVSGKPAYVAILEWDSREVSDRFSAGIIALVRAAHPGALDG